MQSIWGIKYWKMIRHAYIGGKKTIGDNMRTSYVVIDAWVLSFSIIGIEIKLDLKLELHVLGLIYWQFQVHDMYNKLI